MSLACTPNLGEVLGGSNILIDTCVIIESSKNKSVEDFLDSLRTAGCTFVSLPSVRDEYTCGAKSMNEYNELSEYFESQQIILLSKFAEASTSENKTVFDIALRRSSAHNPSYVDRLLLFVPYVYKDSSEKMYFMTSNYRDVPKEFYDLVGFMSYKKGDFHNIGVYEFNQTKFDKIIKRI